MNKPNSSAQQQEVKSDCDRAETAVTFLNEEIILPKVGQNLDHLSRAKTLSVQLEALLYTTTGESGEAFRMVSDTLQDNFMWACSDMARELASLLSQVGVRHE